MKTLHRCATTAALVAASLVWGCDGALIDSEPRPGVLTVSLVTSRPDDGAVSLILRGTGIGDLTTVDHDLELFSFVGDSGESRVAVIGDALSGPLIRFAVPDVNRIAAYTAELVQVADQANELREDLTGYKLVISSGY